MLILKICNLMVFLIKSKNLKIQKDLKIYLIRNQICLNKKLKLKLSMRINMNKNKRIKIIEPISYIQKPNNNNKINTVKNQKRKRKINQLITLIKFKIQNNIIRLHKTM
jgi:hypothetical protein